MKLKGVYLAGVLAAGGVLLATPNQQAMAESGKAELGVLTCTKVGSGLNLIIHSTAEIECVFKGAGGVEEAYKGETGVGLGIDLQWKKEEKLAFTVMGASGADAGNHALAGKYGGAGGSAAVGVGAGANVLVGGSKDSFSLQPIALSASTGIGAAGGVTYLNLEPGDM